MRAPSLRRQRTITINGQKIKMIARRRTIQANFAGWNVSVDGKDYYVALLTLDEAFDGAFAQHVKSGAMDEKV